MPANDTKYACTTGDVTAVHDSLFRMESGKRQTSSGRIRGYNLYTPVGSNDLPPPPYPLVTLLHGFLRNGSYQSSNAVYMAERGFVVLTPDLTRLLWFDDNRMNNVGDVLDHVAWLNERSKTPGDPLHGLIDSTRFSIAGYSAGGAASLEILITAQERGMDVCSTVLLDAVPWERTRNRLSIIKPTNILSLRSEPSFCNEYARVLQFLNALDFPTQDVKVIGSGHCDGEGPTDWGCFCLCGKKKSSFRHIFQRLLHAYLRETLSGPEFSNPYRSFSRLVEDMMRTGSVISRRTPAAKAV